MLDIYVTGIYDNYKLRYAGYAEQSGITNGYCACVCGEKTGSKPETEMQAVQAAFAYAYERGEGVVVYTDFSNIKDRAEGKIKATAQISRTFTNFLNMVKSRIDFAVEEQIPDKTKLVLNSILDNHEPKGVWRGCEVVWEKPKFRVVLRDRDGNVLGDFDEKHFGHVFADAVQFTEWYEKESKNEASDYYGITIERYGLLDRRS